MKLHFFALAAILLFSHVDAADWKYPDLEEGEEYPNWGGTCESGRRQSPINLSKEKALRGSYDGLHFKNYNEEQHDVVMVNNGHTIQLSGFTSNMEVSGGPLRSTYTVEQIHFHWWSEHTLDNVRYPLEVHIVHRNKDYGNMSTAVSRKDGLLVIGVLFHASNRENEVVTNIVENLDKVKYYNQKNKPIKLNETLMIADLFPRLSGYMTYPGSLTTPSCAESVTWIVLTDTFPVQIEQVNKFKEIEFQEGKALAANYRDIQKSFQRELIAVLQETNFSNSRASSRLFAIPAFLFLVQYLFLML